MRNDTLGMSSVTCLYRKAILMKRYRQPAHSINLAEGARIILAHGEVTGHTHEIVAASPDEIDDLPPAQFFQEPGGRRVLLLLRPCLLQHQEHSAIALDPAAPQQVRQGDMLLHPIGAGAWQVIRQREYTPQAIRQVAD